MAYGWSIRSFACTSFDYIYSSRDDRFVEYATKFKEQIFLPKAKNIVKFMDQRQWLVKDKVRYNNLELIYRLYTRA